MRTLPAIIALALCGGSFTTAFAGAGSPECILEKIAEATSPRSIRILLERDASQALLEVKGPYFLFNPHDGTKVSSGLLGKRFMARALDSGLKWGEEFPGIFQLLIHPRSEETAIFVNGIQYNGSIAVYAVGDRINVVNEIDIESYVKAHLANQISSPMESEVIAAMAILARTNAYYASLRNQTVYWHVAASDTNYAGCALVGPNSAIEKAVDSTRHLILVNSTSGKSIPFAATWTEHSAGKTASYQAMFRKDAFAPTVSVDAPHAALDRKEAKWTYSISKKSLAQILHLSQIKHVELFADPASNKVYGVRIKDQEESHDFDFFALQEKLGKNHLLSSDFTISLKDDSIVFNGFGKGHGVGLCLYSASAMAQNGDNAMKILSKFYPETYLLNLNAIPQKAEKSSVY